ncbi:MAG: beta-hydroxyacyl-ACP dehydratase [Phycisphaerae bacterium]|nr:beta-hydroxyacyl-ACP dehydratase [Phycisphaerae bacterium]NUQ44540.1 beta-hydroxyacyl-ACP dehydratase [Phycisphaerae bacterium]
MRWIWIDKFIRFESGRRAVAVKNVSLAEEHLHDHFPGYPIVPASLMIEGMAQTAGILVGEARQFQEKVILAKVKQARFDREVRPGDQLTYDAQIEHVDEAAAHTVGVVSCNGEVIGQVDIVFSHIDQNLSGLTFPQENFVFTDEFKSLLRTFAAEQGGG